MNRYETSFIDKPYVVMTYDCPGLFAVITKLKLIDTNDFECFTVSEYTDEYRFRTQELSDQFVQIIDKYIRHEYDTYSL